MPPELGDAVLHHPDVLLDLGQEDGALDARDQEPGERLGVDVRGEDDRAPGRASSAAARYCRHCSNPLASRWRKPFVGIGQLGGEVADGAAADAVPGALGRQDLVEEGLDLGERVAGVVSEDGGQGPGLEPVEQPVEDRVPEVLLRPEVVIEITLSGTTLPEDVVERSPVVALDGHEPGGHLEDLLLDGRGTHWAVPTGR